MSRISRRGRVRAAVLLAAAGSLVLTSCGSAGSDQQKSVKFVVLGAFTGKSASQNAPILQGAKVAERVLNEQGGISGRPVELVTKDDRGEIASMVTAAREAITDEDVYAVFVGNGTPGALAVQPILQPSGVAVFSVATGPQVSNEKWPGFYRMNSNAAKEATRLVEHFKSSGKKSLGLLWENNDYGSGFANSVKAAAKSAGVPVAASESVAPGSTNLTPEVGKLRAAGVDYLTTALLPAETVTASRAIASVGLDAMVVMNGADMAFPAGRALLGESGAGIMFRYFVYPFDPVLQTKPDTPVAETEMSAEAKKFWSVWYEANGKRVDIAGHSVTGLPTYDWWSYDAMLMVGKAIEAGADDRARVAAAIDKIGSFDLVASYRDIGDGHEFHRPGDMAFGQLQADGTIKYNVK
ncbi:ABC transporter substrate-binding protein [Spirillospora sp. NPDC048819]|uniref:ABC transporter substrate-binding protein n=1 Tax=Spirillospora sp. NPDC048819 TaxID=3155268 RepID=UPI0033E6586D